MDLTFFLELSALLSALGLVVDKFLLKKYKIRINRHLIDYWKQIEDTRFIDSSKLMAEYFLKVIRKIYGDSLWNFKGAICSFFFSALLTLAVFIITRGFATSMSSLGTVIPLIVINFPFDFVTILASVFVMKKVTRLPTISRLFYIFIDLLIAYCLAVACVSTANKFLQGEWNFFSYFAGLFSFYTTGKTNINIVQIAFASTTLIPTIVYVIFFVLLFLSKPIVYVLRYLLELFTQDSEQTLFCYSGTLLGIFLILGKLLFTYYSS